MLKGGSKSEFGVLRPYLIRQIGPAGNLMKHLLDLLRIERDQNCERTQKRKFNYQHVKLRNPSLTTRLLIKWSLMAMTYGATVATRVADEGGTAVNVVADYNDRIGSIDKPN